METEMPLFGQHMDLAMDGSFADFSSQATFDQTLAGKPSPGTPSQFLLTPSSLWDRNSFDDAALDIFADLSDPAGTKSEKDAEATLDATASRGTGLSSEPTQQIDSKVVEPVTVKEESPAPPVVARPSRRLTRATSNGSLARASSNSRTIATAPNTESARVKKSRTTTKKPAKRSRGQAKGSKDASIEEESTGAANAGDQEPLGEEDDRRNKFLERNRVAASKCRQKKKEWMQSLEETKNDLEKTHSSLHETLNGLIAEVSVLKEHLMTHASCGDPNIDRWFTTEARKFVESKTGPDEARRPSSSSGSGETQQSGHTSNTQGSPASSVAAPTIASPEVKSEFFSYDYMPDDMFVDDQS